ncbi:MAG TPA: glutamine--fructose-6-phosphate transaminase (isomerizing) [Chitinophagales bacterium]|nr:glutamine--fructose-6-phosphate transaminase (isomerizing) [Chitinophagales bacterium]HMW12328.1 glutamine--fructose-6-phosphate transaminase (isomerizing) [Chitinophagales bacterium]HMX59794.1 glutamine--fructose-6-phosphate transaminase (isomerizing) [Chitinophagales bacterium]HMY22602.1 glutamine--fructose-6-phosphate transaminase (isomerizing) [Chitinophagales bacterium]HMZ33450.1 glutamine--fructose-6-phosphate transaminase (isomerizing) [Chitinophagales bacterium]
MCGIVGYIGKKQAFPIIINGLKRLEYRGYDSAGIALLSDQNALNIYKKKGKVANLEEVAEANDVSGNIGIGHTRWATHGEANDVNAHPHFNATEDLAVIHNGIIENYYSLKTELQSRGYVFRSETDTEVLVHLIEEIKKNVGCPLEEAVRLALNEVIGAYAIVVISKKENNKLITAKLSSPMVIGFGENELFVASDGSPLIEHTKKVSYLEDGQMAVLSIDGTVEVKSIKDNTSYVPYIDELQLKLEQIEKGGFDHFMMKEIHEQPQAIKNSIRGRIDSQQFWVNLGGVREHELRFKNASKITIVACGTSWHSALIGEYLIEELARINVEVEYASEFRYRNPIITENDVVIAISQSGETADTRAALELAKAKGALTYGICNVVGSSISRMTDAGSYTHAGPEIGVASTKAFTTQVSILALLALQLAELKGTLSQTKFHEYITELEALPSKIESILKAEPYIKKIADTFQNATNFLYLGRGFNFPVALEGALKLKEISYIHAEGYPAAEMKHGPIALIDENMPVVVLAPHTQHYEKVLSNIEEVKTRKGQLIAVVTEGDAEISKIAEYVIQIPDTPEPFTPILSVIPLQLLAYHIAVMRGCDVDQPRNLAKSVTVE